MLHSVLIRQDLTDIPSRFSPRNDRKGGGLKALACLQGMAEQLRFQ